MSPARLQIFGFQTYLQITWPGSPPIYEGAGSAFIHPRDLFMSIPVGLGVGEGE
jgi:hypothetical protein